MITNQLFLLKSVLAVHRAKACRTGWGKVICVWSLCMSHLQRWWEIMATVWGLSKPQTAQLDSIWVKLESKCCPIITLWTFFSALRSDFSTITITQWPYPCQDTILAPDKLFKRPSGSQTVNVYAITKWYYLGWNSFFCVLCACFIWQYIHLSKQITLFSLHFVLFFHEQTTHAARRGTASVVKTRKCNISPKNNWQQLAFAQLPANLLLVFCSQPNHFQTRLR